MKRIVLIAAVILMSFPMMAQKDPVDLLFDKYSGKEGFTTVIISSKMFSLFSDMEVEDEEFNEMMSSLESIRILATDETSMDESINFFEEVMKDLNQKDYEELMTVKDADQDVKFLIRERNGKIAELLLVSGGGGDNAIISIRGNIDLKNISKLAKSMDIEGLDKLEELEEEK
ncbi:MAG: DUF4252 domain-containing protein [Bacteroidales bacterium]|nr:MAG: DUF4252 domain-containing protein [Bacteroidales bacterium]